MSKKSAFFVAWVRVPIRKAEESRNERKRWKKIIKYCLHIVVYYTHGGTAFDVNIIYVSFSHSRRCFVGVQLVSPLQDSIWLHGIRIVAGVPFILFLVDFFCCGFVYLLANVHVCAYIKLWKWLKAALTHTHMVIFDILLPVLVIVVVAARWYVCLLIAH